MNSRILTAFGSSLISCAYCVFSSLCTLCVFCMLCLFFVSCSCGGNAGNGGNGSKGTDSGGIVEVKGDNIISDAKLFTVVKKDGYRVVEVVNPWDTLKLLSRYILVNKKDTLPENLPEGIIVRTPVERIVAYTAIDVGSIEALGGVEKIVGVCEAKYIISPYIRESLKKGSIKDLGSYTKPNIEQLLSSNADLIITSPYRGRDYGVVEKMGIPIAECASYMEKSPLGRCEWIKFYAEFLDETKLGDSIYNDISNKYIETVNYIAEKVETKPTILPDKRYGQVWYASSGDSYAAILYKDAGANYFWSNSITPGSIPLSFEKVFKIAHNADVWIFTYVKSDGHITLDELRSEYESYSEFAAFKNKRVYACNSELIPLYEESPLRPDLLLLDLAKMLHPKLFDDYTFRYYKKLE